MENKNKYLLWLSIVLAVIVALALAYYFAIFLPHFKNQQVLDKKIADCSQKAEVFFGNYKMEKPKEKSELQNHFNKKLNRCLVRIDYDNSNFIGTDLLDNEFGFNLFDINENKRISYCMTKFTKLQKETGDIVFSCRDELSGAEISKDDKDSKKESFYSLMRKYMTE